MVNGDDEDDNNNNNNDNKIRPMRDAEIPMTRTCGKYNAREITNAKRPQLAATARERAICETRPPAASTAIAESGSAPSRV